MFLLHVYVCIYIYIYLYNVILFYAEILMIMINYNMQLILDFIASINIRHKNRIKIEKIHYLI